MLLKLVASLGRVRPTKSAPIHEILSEFNNLKSFGFLGPPAAFYNQLNPACISFLPVDDSPGLFSCGVFVLPPTAKMQLHDHPNMNGYIRVVDGSLLVRSFDKVNAPAADGLVIARLTKVQELTAPITATLSPDSCNLHELVAGKNGCIMLDVLTPDYDEHKGRSCNYYRSAEVGQDGAVKLEPMSFDDGVRRAAWPVWPVP